MNLIAFKKRKSLTAEAYRSVRTNIQYLGIDKNIKTVVMTSPEMGEGKSTTISNVAETFAQSGSRVIVVDADLRRPTIYKQFGLDNAKGLTNVLAGQVTLDQVIKSAGSDVHILTSGPTPPNPAEMLGSSKMVELIETLKGYYDVVLIDTPPVNAVTDAVVLSTMVDGVILVIAAGQTTIEAGKRAVKALQVVNANILGTIMNKIPISKNDYGYYNYAAEEETTSKTAKRTGFGFKRKAAL